MIITLHANDPRLGEYSAGGELIRRPALTLNGQGVRAGHGSILQNGRFFMIVDAGSDTGDLKLVITATPESKKDKES